MILPNGYFWIPTYEQRYAMKAAQGFGLLDFVFSFVTPGLWSKPTAIKTHRLEAGLTVYLSRNGRKERRRIHDLKKMIETSTAYKTFTRLSDRQNDASSTATIYTTRKPVSKDVDVNNGWIDVRTGKAEVKKQIAGWIVGTNVAGVLTCSDKPKVHSTEDSAYREAERLATLRPGFEYIVLKTVRSVIAGGIKITNL